MSLRPRCRIAASALVSYMRRIDWRPYCRSITRANVVPPVLGKCRKINNWFMDRSHRYEGRALPVVEIVDPVVWRLHQESEVAHEKLLQVWLLVEFVQVEHDEVLGCR